MRKEFEDSLTTFKGIYTWTTDNGAVIAAYPGLVTACATFCDKVNLIEAKESLFTSASKGSAGFKKFLRVQAVDIVFTCASALYLVGKEENNFEIKDYCSFPKSDLDKARDTEFAVTGKKIAGWAVTKAVPLAGHSWTAADTLDLTDKVTQYDEVIGRREVLTEVRKTALEEMKALFKEVTKFLNEELDREVEMIKRDHPTEYSLYFGAREIKSRGVRHEPPAPPVPPTNPE